MDLDLFFELIFVCVVCSPFSFVGLVALPLPVRYVPLPLVCASCLFLLCEENVSVMRLLTTNIDHQPSWACRAPRSRRSAPPVKQKGNHNLSFIHLFFILYSFIFINSSKKPHPRFTATIHRRRGEGHQFQFQPPPISLGLVH